MLTSWIGLVILLGFDRHALAAEVCPGTSTICDSYCCPADSAPDKEEFECCNECSMSVYDETRDSLSCSPGALIGIVAAVIAVAVGATIGVLCYLGCICNKISGRPPYQGNCCGPKGVGAKGSPPPKAGYQNAYPPQAYPPQGYPPQGYPPQGYPPQGYPPQAYPPQAYPPGQPGAPAGGAYSQYPPPAQGAYPAATNAPPPQGAYPVATSPGYAGGQSPSTPGPQNVSRK